MKTIPILLAGFTGLAVASDSTPTGKVPEGLSSSDWSSIRAAYEAGRHAVHRKENGTLTARNPGQQWRTDFDGKGFTVTPDHGQWTWGLELTGYGERTLDSTPSSITHDGGKISIRRDENLTEWFINDIRGLEQGWTIHSRSVGVTPTSSHPTSKNLTLTLALRGDLQPRVSPDSSNVSFQNASGDTALTFGGLKAWDADGKNLTVHFEDAGDSAIRIAVDDQNARYPITIDPIAQQAYLKSGNNGPASGDLFGRSVAVSGDTVVVGAEREDSSTTGANTTPNVSAPDSGAAYVFVRNGTTWSQQAYLKASNSGADDGFGRSVAISVDTVVVATSGEDSSTTGVNSTPNDSASGSGAAYVFVRSGTTWSEQAYLKASNTGTNDFFGISVAISGDTVAVGAPGEDSSTTGVNSTPNESASSSGAAYVFVRTGTTWSEQAYLKSSNSETGDGFGRSVAVSGDTVVVGADGEGSSTTGVNSTPNESASTSGAAYVFVRSGTTWSEQAYLKASNTGAGDRFGSSVAVAGNTAVVGAAYEDSSTAGVNSIPNNSAPNSGAAYIFLRSGTTWSEQAYLKASNTGTDDGFGESVAVSGDTVVVGASGEDGANGFPPNSGAAYIFVGSGTMWSQQGAVLRASNAGTDDRFGCSVAVSGDMVVVGAYGEDSTTTGVNSTPNDTGGIYFDSGAVYVYARNGTLWIQQAYLKDNNSESTPGVDDQFGYSVAVSGDTVVVGAFGEESSTTGVNSIPNEDGDSGAAYVFVRSGTTWSQQAYLKASNTGDLDFFGYSVAISGDTIAVGAYGEDSSTTGVNSTPNENASNSGAAYVFVRSGDTWTQQAYLKASNSGLEDGFGFSVAVSGDTITVGSLWEDSSTTGVNSIPNDGTINSGAAYVFVRSGTMWSQQAYLKASNTEGNDYFGYSVAVAGDTAVVGTINEDSSTTGVNSVPNNSATDSGAAYVFVRSGTTWSQQAYLKASNTGGNDYFGYSVAIAGDTAAVGARYEDSSTTGVNSVPNNSATDSGAAYVFVRSGTTWGQQAYLKASNSGAGDSFGSSVACAGNTVVVGAFFEDSSTTGVNSTPNESASSSGAAYVFVSTGTTWSEQAYLKASNTGTNDLFGRSVAVSGDTVIVGADNESSSTSGVNSIPNDRANASGAAYVFDLNAVAASSEIAIEQAGSVITSGAIKAFNSAAVGSTSDVIFTILNTGTADLNLTGTPKVAVSGSSDFTVTAQPASPISPSGSSNFTVRFTPTGSGLKTASLSIPNNDSNETPFVIELTGTALSFATDNDNDGLSDASEFNMAALGFDWQVNQSALVNTLFDNAAGAGLFTASQVQAMNTGTPLIAKDPATGKFKLTMDWKKSTNLTDFLDFPAPPGSSVSINSQGDVEFEFPSSENAAFFRIGLE